MKILTYGSYGGLVPKAVADRAWKDKLSQLASPVLVEFVEGFSPDGEVVPVTGEILRAHPDKLYLSRVETVDGIRKNTYLGYAELDPSGSVAAQVTVNEYDEDAIHVILREHDGAQSLQVLPRFGPVVGIPGLYREITEGGAPAAEPAARDRAAALLSEAKSVPDGDRAVRQALRDLKSSRYGADGLALLDAVAGVDGPVAASTVEASFLAAIGASLDEFLDAAGSALEKAKDYAAKQERLKRIPNARIRLMDVNAGLLPVKIPDEILSSDNPGAVLDALRAGPGDVPAAPWTSIMNHPGLVPGITYVPVGGEGLEALPVIRQDDWPVPRAGKYKRQADAVRKKILKTARHVKNKKE